MSLWNQGDIHDEAMPDFDKKQTSFHKKERSEFSVLLDDLAEEAYHLSQDIDKVCKDIMALEATLEESKIRTEYEMSIPEESGWYLGWCKLRSKKWALVLKQYEFGDRQCFIHRPPEIRDRFHPYLNRFIIGLKKHIQEQRKLYRN